MNGRQRCLAVIDGEAPDRVPVFPLLMAFAADRVGISYKQYASDGLALAEAQAGIYERYGVDAVTACSDAFRVSADLGGRIVFPEDKPPYLASPLVRGKDDLARLGRPDVLAKGSRIADRVDGVRNLASALGDECLVLGWIDLPFAEACSLCGVTEFMMLLVDEPAFAHRVLEFLTDIVVDFALAQLEAGAPMVGAGDAAASLISPSFYREFALPYEKQVFKAIHHAGGYSKLHICGNTSALLEDMAQCGADLYNVDHMVDLETAAKVYGKAGKCLKGNLNPVDLLDSSPEECIAKAKGCIKAAGTSPYILSPGCEVPAAVSDETFEAFCGAVLT